MKIKIVILMNKILIFKNLINLFKMIRLIINKFLKINKV